MTNRRTFLTRSSVALAGARLARSHGGTTAAAHTRSVRDAVGVPRDTRVCITDADVRALALRAIDAARAAGATYADVHLVRRLTEQYYNGAWISGSENISVGVRALANGYWGFAASPYWMPDEMTTLATDATHQAKTYAAAGAPNTIEWNAVPVATGTWSTPVRIDPFTIPIEEKCDYMNAMISLAARPDRARRGLLSASFTRQERAVATSESAYFTQTLYDASAMYEIQAYGRINGEERHGKAMADKLGWSAAGWEFLLDAKIPEQIPRIIAAAEEDMLGLPTMPGEIGRYDIVIDAETMTRVLAATLGTATQLDRALGYEANATGTSYLGPDPMRFLGTAVASPIVSVNANRSMPQGLATVKWDEEGVVPDAFPLVRSGTLVDYQTTREQAAWLAPWYQRQHMTPHSHGCVNLETALTIPMQHSPNLILEPGGQRLGFDDMVSATRKGVAIMHGGVETDFQGRNGFLSGRIREIVNGRLGKHITAIKPFFNTTTLWKSVTALGGAESVYQGGVWDTKGEPAQSASYSVRAVPAAVVKIPFVNASV